MADDRPDRVYRNLDVGTTGQVVASAPAILRGYYLYNGAAAARTIKVYDKATAPSQADTPRLSITLPSGAAANLDGLAIPFGAEIGLRATTGAADSDTGAPGAGDVQVHLFYA